jgi:hypothetical protein
MTMHRRPLGLGRTLAVIAGILLVVGCVLPWWTLGGESGIPAIGGNGFDGSGFVVFLVGIAVVALVALPYAAGDRPLAIDGWLSFLILTILGWLGVGLRIIGLIAEGAFHFDEPIEILTNGPGLWLVLIGMVILSRATWHISREPAYR